MHLFRDNLVSTIHLILNYMAVKLYKPTSPGRRIHSVTDYSVLSKTKKTPKGLIVSKARPAGRNNSGKITVRHQGGGAKRKIV